MPEGRMIKRRLSKSKKYGNVKNDSARALYPLLVINADKEGRLEAAEFHIKGAILPYCDDWNLSKIKKILKVLHDIGLIILYRPDEETYLQVVNFKEGQKAYALKVEAPSEIPPYREGTEVYPIDNSKQARLGQSKFKEGSLEVNLSKENLSKENKEKPLVLDCTYLRMTEEEQEKLKKELGQERYDYWIEYAENYIGETDKRIKEYASRDHYRSILKWTVDERKERKKKIAEIEKRNADYEQDEKLRKEQEEKEREEKRNSPRDKELQIKGEALLLNKLNIQKPKGA